MERDFKGVWIPKEVWLDDRLTALDKIILVEIDSLDNGENCFASNEYLAKFCQCSVAKITKSISTLIKLGYIEAVSFDGRRRFIRSCLVKSTRLPSKKYEADSEKVRDINIYNNIDNNIDIKERKKERSFDEIFESKKVSQGLKEAFIEFVKSRKLNGKKMTSRALELAIDKVRRMSDNESEQIAIINQSIENSWQGLFPLKDLPRTSYKEVMYDEASDKDVTWKRSFAFWESILGYKPNETQLNVEAAKKLIEMDGEDGTQKLIASLRMRSEYKFLASNLKNISDFDSLLKNREDVWSFYSKNHDQWIRWQERSREGKKRWEV